MSRLWWAAVLATGAGTALPGCATAATRTAAPATTRADTTGTARPASTPDSCTRTLSSADSVPPAQLGAVHFLTPTIGVGLTASEAPCSQTRWHRQPVLLALTRDGGRHWITEGAPLPAAPAGVLVQQITATSPQGVWASTGAGPLFATTDGGADWTVQPVPRSVAALTITRKTLWTLGCPHRNNVQCAAVLAHRRLPDGAWRQVRLPHPVVTPAAELAVVGAAVVVAPRPSSGVRLAISSDRGQRWRSTRPTWMGRPCWGGFLTTSGPSDWWVICLGGAAAGSSDKALLHTTDGGRTWSIASQVRSLTAPTRPGTITRAEPNALAAASRTRLWLAAQHSMYESADAGMTWREVPGVNPQGGPAAFDVLSPTHAWLLAPGQGLWATTDGRRWRAL